MSHVSKCISTRSILAKDAEPGQIYVTQGGEVTTDTWGKVAWGYDRIKVLQITPRSVQIETPWQTILDLPLNYILYTTPEKEIREAHSIYSRTERKHMTYMTLQEAIEVGIETISDPLQFETTKKSRELSDVDQKIISLLSSERGNTILIVSRTLNISTQRVRDILRKKILPHGYILLNVTNHVYKLVKE